MLLPHFCFMNNYNQLDFTKLNPVRYLRKSSESEDKQVLSIGSQKDETGRIATFYKLPDFIETFEESKSAKKEFLRPGFTRMIEMIKRGEIDSIVCWKLDRLARNMTEGGMLIDLLSSGVLKAIITHDKVYYPSDNVLLMAVEFGQGKQFVKDLSVNVKRGQHKKATMGIPHGVATLGFLNDKTEEKGNRNWLIDQLRFNAIKLLFEMFLTGAYSAGKLHKYAVEELKLNTVKRKRIGGALIAMSRIYEILKDPIYAGFFYQGGERYEFDSRLPRIITEDQHNKVKALLAKKNIPKSQHNEATYAGFMQSDQGEFMGQDVKYQLICDCKKKFGYLSKTHCPKCEKEIEQLENPKYLSFTYYYNVKKKKSSQKYKSVEEKKVTEQLVCFADNYLTFSPELAEWSKSYITELKNKEINENVFRKEKEQLDMEEYDKKKGRLREMLREKYITPEEYKSDLVLLDSQYKVTEKKNVNVDWYTKMNEIVNLTQLARDVFAKGTIQAKRVLLSNMSSNLVWNEKELFIYNDISINKLVECIKGIKSKYPEFEPKNFLAMQHSKEKTDRFQPVFSTMLGR